MHIPYGKQQITEEDIDAVVRTLKSDFLTQGPLVEDFEKKFTAFVGCHHSVAVTNGTAALHLAALALGVQKGDRVLCTPNTFVASANCILYCGGDVDFIDIDPKTYCLDLDLLEQKLSTSPRGIYKGIVAVDFAGYPVDFERIRAIADKYQLWVIEDACHALGASFVDSHGKTQKSGNCAYADISIFSFHPVKHIATGEGGMATTNRTDLNEKLRLLRTHGITKNASQMKENHGGWYYEMQELGFNYRISDILCALGSSQLSRIEGNLASRRRIAKIYDEALKGVVGLPTLEPRKEHAYHLYVIQTEKRLELYNYLKQKNIHAQVHYIPVYAQPYYVERYGRQQLTMMDAYYERALSLPMYHSLKESEQDYVIEAVKSFFK